MKWIAFLGITILLTSLMAAEVHADAYADSAQGGSSNPQYAVGVPDGLWAYVCSYENIRNTLYLYWGESPIPQDGSAFRLRFYMGPDAATFNAPVYCGVMYSGGSGSSVTLNHSASWQVLTSPYIYPPVGQTLQRVSAVGYYDIEGWIHVFPFTVDAVEIVTDGSTEKPYEIISATFDKSVYQSGVDVAVLTVVTRRLAGTSSNLQLTVQLSPLCGTPFTTGTEEFSLNQSCYKVSHFNWALPTLSYATEFNASVYLYELGSGLMVDQKDIEPAFIGTPLSSVQIQQYQDAIRQCYDANSSRPEELGKVVPLSFNEMHAATLCSDLCVAGQLYSAQRKAESWAAVTSALMKFHKYAGIVLKAIFLKSMPIITFTETLKTLEAKTGYDFYQDIGGIPMMTLGKTVTSLDKGTLVDSLAVWVPSGFDSTQGEFADALLIEGKCDVMVEADSSWAVPDSAGLIGVWFASIDTIGSATFVSPSVFRVDTTSSSNPHSASIFKTSGCSGQFLDVGLLHHTETGSLVFLRYPRIVVTGQTLLSIAVSDTLETVAIQCDFDGDGEVDYSVYPQGTAVTDVPDSPPASTVSLYQNYPNPFNPSTLVRYSLPLKSHVTLDIYDISGKRIARLVNVEQERGSYTVKWNGKDEHGISVASGIYFYRLTAGKETISKKMVLLR